MAGYKPRVISLTKRPGHSFGFYLRMEHDEEGHLIRCLEMGGPAELAGMKDGDRILRVNGTFVDGLSHSEVVEMVKNGGASVAFHILDESSYVKAKAQGVDLLNPGSTPVANGVAKEALKPKLCYMVKSSSGYGFSIRSVKDEEGLFMTAVIQGGVADRAGVNVNDRLLEVNGENVEGSTHDQVVDKIRLGGSSIMFLLVDEETDRHYQSKRMKIGAWLATAKYLPHKPRVIDMTKGPDGYGFLLKEETNQTGHFIKDIDRGSPGERAGLHSHPPTSLSTTQVQKLLVRGQQQSADGKEAGAAKQPTVVSPLSETCTPLNPAGQAVKEDTLECPTAAGAGGDLPQLITEQDDDGEKDVDDAHDDDSTEMQIDVEDSDDSEVSMVYEEEEVDEEEDEEEEEEEGLNYESSHSGNYPCSVCDLQLPSKFKLQDHMNLHTGARPYCCAECGKRFCQIYNYRVHLRTHATKTKVDRLQCRICLKSFASQDDLKVHLSRTHFENEFYECDLCKRVFTCLKVCEFHVQSHRCKLDLVCDKCGRNFSSPKYLARHQKTTCHRNFKCTDCPMTFTKKNALLRHSFSHLGLLPYTCIRCRCHFRLARLYRKHKCEPERLHCVACLREFLSQEDFQQHKKDTGCWGNQEPKGDEIRCLECGQRFDTSEELKKHAGAHQRVLKCAECGKGFRSALLLMSHMGGHAGNSPCLCQSCGVGFPHQQNYDSHLKTCGKTPQPASAPKKRPASKSSSSETKKVNAKPDSSNATNTAATPAAVSNNPAAVSNNPAAFSNNPAAVSNNPAAVSDNPAAVSNNPAAVSNNPAAVSDSPAAPVKDSRSPGLVTEAVSSGSGPSDGLWKLTLNRQPPPGVKLVVFLPVCATQADGLTLPSEISPTLPVPLTQGPPQEAFPPVNAALGAPLNAPLNLVTGIKRDPQWEAPLDLSKKCNLSKFVLNNIPLLPVKRELGEFKISGEQKKKTNPVETDTRTEVKQFKVDAMDFSSFKVNTTSTGLKIDIKKEPQSPGPDCDLRSSRSCQLTEKEIKMEVDTSRPADVEK